MKTGKLECGFKFKVDETVLDDMEILDALAESQEDALKITIVINKVLGKEQKKELYDKLREKDGRVPVQKVSDALVEIFNQMGEDGKNS